MISLTYERASELLSYDPITGALTWRVAVCNVKAGDVAGSVDSKGYVGVQVGGRKYSAHRLAWLLMTGAWPTEQVDHRDGVKTNNRWSNLRDVSASVNQQNVRTPRKRSGDLPLGVRHLPRLAKNPFAATIRVSGKNLHLGCYPTSGAAHAAYVEAKRQMHEGNTL